MFVHSNVTGQMLLVYPAKGAQAVTESGPHPFGGVGMNCSNASAILVTRPFMEARSDGAMRTRKAVVAPPLVRVDPRRSGGNLATGRLSVLPSGWWTTRKRPCPLSRPLVPTTGGRSVAEVPCPRCLFARPRGGSAGSACCSPFFPRMLTQFSGLRHALRQRLSGLQGLGIGVNGPTPRQHGVVL